MIHFEQIHFGAKHFGMRHFGGEGAAPAPDDAWYPPINKLDRHGMTQANRDKTGTLERHGIETLERH